MTKYCYFWFRRDLRVTDNCGFYHALNSGLPVKPIFIFDTNILSELKNKKDARVTFIYDQLRELQNIFQGKNAKFPNLEGDIEVWHGDPMQVWKEILNNQSVGKVVTNRDYEPQAIKRDNEISALCSEKGIIFETHKDQVVFEQNEVVKDDGKPYTVFTPFMKKWKSKLISTSFDEYPSEQHLVKLATFKFREGKMLTLESLGFERSDMTIPSEVVPQSIIRNYETQRDIPAIAGTSRLSVHFRFGTISVREKASKALALNEKWLNELVWREFYMYILFHFPQVLKQSFKAQYDRIEWLNKEADFEHWKQGKTGYPMVDAGMRELNATGFMHNRVRMVVASFLTKHLLIDWRWGEAYFAEKLLDFELSSNNGGWQWAAGCGVDAAPYFRVFNPTLQQQKFDPQFLYIKKWVPEYGTPKYSTPIVEHSFARDRCLETYKKALLLS